MISEAPFTLVITVAKSVITVAKTVITVAKSVNGSEVIITVDH